MFSPNLHIFFISALRDVKLNSSAILSGLGNKVEIICWMGQLENKGNCHAFLLCICFVAGHGFIEYKKNYFYVTDPVKPWLQRALGCGQGLFNRPGVARAVPQTPSLLID